MIEEFKTPKVNWTDLSNTLNYANKKLLYREIKCHNCGLPNKISLHVDSESIKIFNRLIKIIKDAIIEFPEIEENICNKIIDRVLEEFKKHE